LPPPALCTGDLEPTAGESRRSHKLRIGRYNQHFVDALAFDENPVEYLMNKFPEAGLKPEGMRAMLGRFGLSGHHHLTPIVKLSGSVNQTVNLSWALHCFPNFFRRQVAASWPACNSVLAVTELHCF
jgi:ATPase subunit of ABC transporter with duplicated ATPase domains